MFVGKPVQSSIRLNPPCLIWPYDGCGRIQRILVRISSSKFRQKKCIIQLPSIDVWHIIDFMQIIIVHLKEQNFSYLLIEYHLNFLWFWLCASRVFEHFKEQYRISLRYMKRIPPLWQPPQKYSCSRALTSTAKSWCDWWIGTGQRCERRKKAPERP